MKMKLALVALAIGLGACAKFESNKARADFKIYGKGEATSALMRAEQWCISGSKPVSAYSFRDGNTGDFTVMNADGSAVASKDGYTWDLQDDALTVTLPQKFQPNVLTKKVRFTGALGKETLVLMEEDGSFILLNSCKL